MMTHACPEDILIPATKSWSREELRFSTRIKAAYAALGAGTRAEAFQRLTGGGMSP